MCAQVVERMSATLDARPLRDEGPQWVGHTIRIFWPDDAEWYLADVTAWHPERATHTLLYHCDAEEEELDLRLEDLSGRLQWLQGLEPAAWAPAPPVPLSAISARFPSSALPGISTMMDT